MTTDQNRDFFSSSLASFKTWLTTLNIYSLVVLFLVFLQSSLVFPQENVPELDIDVTEGVVEPIPIAFPNFITTDFSSSIIANEISKVVKNDLLKKDVLFQRIS